AEQVFAELDERDFEYGEMRVFAAERLLARHDPHAATVTLGPVLDGSVPAYGGLPPVRAFLLEAIARDALGGAAAAARALERALDLAKPDGVISPFLLHPAPALLHRHARHRTAHADLIAEILALLARVTSPPTGVPPLLAPLSNSEVRVLRY